ncbi:hypothetical protein ACHAQJ_003932 [Trichoderma viride]
MSRYLIRTEHDSEADKPPTPQFTSQLLSRTPCPTTASQHQVSCVLSPSLASLSGRYTGSEDMPITRDSNGAMNPFATPFVPFAYPQLSFATQHTKNSRLNWQTEKYEDEDAAFSAPDQVMSSGMRWEISQPSDGSPFVHSFASLIAQARCEVSQGHAATNCVCDQMLRPTTLNPSESAHKNPSPRLRIDPSEGISHDPESRWKRPKRSSALGGKTIEKSESNIGGERVPKFPEAKASQQHRMSGEKTTSDTDNGSAPYNNLDGAKARDHDGDLVEESSDAPLPDYYQGASEETELPSAVNGPQAREENDQDERPQQDCQVLLSLQQRHSTSKQPTQQSAQIPTMQPHNAVTNPSARYSRKTQVSSKPTKIQTSTEVASWSQSKRWVSSETRERRAFQKMILNLQFMKADQSPFIPKSPAELTKFKISLADAKRQKLTEEVSILEEKTRKKDLAKASGSKPVSQPQVLLFNGREMEDKLSPVFAAQNCFNKEDTAEANHHVEWPSLAELKEEGDKRARFGRYLPLPRMNFVAPQILEREQESAYNADGSIL